MSQTSLLTTSFSTASNTLSSAPLTTLQLTTVFTPPAFCFLPTYIDSTIENDIISSAANDSQDPWALRRNYDVSTECFPSGFPLVYSARVAGKNVTVSGSPTRNPMAEFYSPGICPFGYTIGIGSINGPSTYNWCCPSAYDWGLGNCVQSATATAVLIQSSLTTTVPVNYQWAAALMYVTQSSDSALFASDGTFHPSTTSMATSTASSTIQTVTVTPSPSSTAQSKGSTLTEGDWAGVGVGAGVGALVAFLAVVVFWRRRRSAKNYQAPRVDSGWKAEKVEPDRDAWDRPGVSNVERGRSELGGAEEAVYEAASTDRVLEMDNTNTRSELDAGWHGREVAAK